MYPCVRLFWLLAALAGEMVAAPPAAPGQPAAAAATSGLPSAEERRRLGELSAADHADMMAQLGIVRLRPGRSGGNTPGQPNAANYDPAQANPFPNYPDALVMNDGRRVTSPAQWWRERRPEIVDAFERDVVGRVPAQVPAVRWTVVRSLATEIGGVRVQARELVGRVEKVGAPGLAVSIRAALVTPAAAPRPVPVLVMFGFGNMPDQPAPAFGPAPAGPTSPELLVRDGWGYVSLEASSIQPDNGAGLTAGIIGLVNGGLRRQPDNWGALRAWAWGASRVLDFLETDASVDARKVGIEGVSRFGKAALVTMAFDPRFAVALVGSSGEGGVKPHRRNFGEAVENLTSAGEYHWMAGNFLKYGAEESRFGRKDAGDLPVEANELIALCAPRPVFVSYGVPEKGDAKWLDHQGSFMATVAAGAVYRLLGARDLGVTEDYRQAVLPPVNHGRLDGDLAWRQHDGGHEDRTNLPYFLAWADRELGHARPAAATGATH